MKLDLNNLEEYSEPDDSRWFLKKEKKHLKRMRKWQN